MKRIGLAAIAAAVLACALLGIAGTVAWQWRALQKIPSVKELLGVQESAEQVQLYARTANQDFVTAHDYLSGVNLFSRPFMREERDNGNTVDVYRRSDRTAEFSFEWYAAPPGQQQRLNVATLYDTDGTTIKAQVIFRRDGTRESRKVLVAANTYETTVYYEDGSAKAEVTVLGPAPNSYNDTPRLLGDTRFYRNGIASHTEVLDDKLTRTTTELDEHGQQIKVSVITNSLDGSTVVAYFPGTHQVRLSASSDMYTMTTNYYRIDGTLEKTAVANGSSIEVTFFDATGKNATLTQGWHYTTEQRNDTAYPTKLVIVQVNELNAKGERSRHWMWEDADPHPLWLYEEFNVSVPNPVAGQPAILCKRVAWFYRNGVLDRTNFEPADKNVKEWTVSHVPEENIKPQEVPPADLIDPQLDPDVPVPMGYAWQ